MWTKYPRSYGTWQPGNCASTSYRYTKGKGWGTKAVHQYRRIDLNTQCPLPGLWDWPQAWKGREGRVGVEHRQGDAIFAALCLPG